jgi:hypothetical protein
LRISVAMRLPKGYCDAPACAQTMLAAVL